MNIHHINIFPGTSPLDNILDIDHTLYSASRKNSAPSTWKHSGTVPGKGVFLNHIMHGHKTILFCSQLCDFQKLRASLLGFTAGFFKIGWSRHSSHVKQCSQNSAIASGLRFPSIDVANWHGSNLYAFEKIVYKLVWKSNIQWFCCPTSCLVRACPCYCIQDFMR